MAKMGVTGPCFIYVGLGTIVQPIPPGIDQGAAEVAAAIAAAGGSAAGLALGGVGQAVAGEAGPQPLNDELGDQPVFLGTCERGPRTLSHTYWHEVFQDDYGHRVPIDLIYESEEAFIFAELNRFNELVLAAVQERMFRQGIQPLPERGFHDDMAVGTMAKAEKKSYAVWLSFPYARKLIHLFSGMPANFCFPACVAWGPDEQDPLGTQVRKVRLVWRAIRLQNGSLSWVYFHDTQTALPPPD